MFRKLRSIFNSNNFSYSQSGEDRIVNFIFANLNIKTPTYFDIGTHHPIDLNNTFVFYKKNSRGLCIEPNPHYYKIIKNLRPKDIVLQVGIGQKSELKKSYYLMSSSTLNTFSKQAAELIATTNCYGPQKVIGKLLIDIYTLESLFESYFTPNFLSIDVEGGDLEVLKSANFKRFRPEVICVETLNFRKDKKLVKNLDLINFLLHSNYKIYADTHINTIFIDKKYHNTF